MIVIKLPAKRSASNLLQAKAANDESTTILTSIVTAEHQLRSPLGEFQTAVTNAQPDGAGDQAPSTPLGKITALRSPCLAGSYEGIAMAKPPLVKEITVQLPKCKSPEAQEALAKTMDDQKIEDELGLSKCPRLVANACCDEG